MQCVCCAEAGCTNYCFDLFELFELCPVLHRSMLGTTVALVHCVHCVCSVDRKSDPISVSTVLIT